MDAVAVATGLDPAEVRRRNFVPREAFPYTSATGNQYDSGDYEATLDHALRLFDYEKARRDQAEARRAGRLVGIGLATFTEICGFGLQSARYGEGVGVGTLPPVDDQRRSSSRAAQDDRFVGLFSRRGRAAG